MVCYFEQQNWDVKYFKEKCQGLSREIKEDENECCHENAKFWILKEKWNQTKAGNDSVFREIKRPKKNFKL